MEERKMIASVEFEIPVWVNYIQWSIKKRKWVGYMDKPPNNGSIPFFYTGKDKPVRHLQVVE
jgi:hypothetical protein